MSLTSESMGPADIAAVCGNGYGNNGYNNGGMFGNDWAWIVILLLFGWGGRGFGGYGGFGGGFGGGQGGGYGYPCCGTPATQADLSAAFASNSVLSGINGIDSTLCQGFNGINTAILQNGYNTQAGINTLSHQLADCCCTTQRAIDGVRYDMATQSCAVQNTIQNTTRDIIDSQTSGINAIMGKLSQMEYNGLNDKYQAALAENQALKFQASQTAQNAFITANQEAQTAELLRRLGRDCPVPAYWVNPPTPVPVPCGTCNTCGC